MPRRSAGGHMGPPPTRTGAVLPRSRFSNGRRDSRASTVEAKESNVGGVLGHKLAKLGIKAVIVEKTPRDDALRVLKIAADGSWSFERADELRGLGNYATAERLLSGSGKTRAVVSIGPAGEMKMGAASIAVNDPEGRPTRHAARGGLGALMGAKGLKAIVVDDGNAKNVDAADKDGFREAMLRFSKVVLDDPRTHNLS